MKAWVTGAGGFMGVHLVEMLIGQSYEVLASHYQATTNFRDLNDNAKVVACDLRDRASVQGLIEDFKPDKIFHLGAQSYPTVSWEDPWTTTETNVI